MKVNNIKLKILCSFPIIGFMLKNVAYHSHLKKQKNHPLSPKGWFFYFLDFMQLGSMRGCFI